MEINKDYKNGMKDMIEFMRLVNYDVSVEIFGQRLGEHLWITKFAKENLSAGLMHLDLSAIDQIAEYMAKRRLDKEIQVIADGAGLQTADGCQHSDTYFDTGSGKTVCQECGDAIIADDPPKKASEAKWGGLDLAGIKKLASGKGVKASAVENFLSTISGSERIDQANLSADAVSYKWNAATVEAIKAGLKLAYHG